MEEEVISTQPKSDYQAIGDTQQDVVSVELVDKDPVDTPPVENTNTTADKQSATLGEESPVAEDHTRKLIAQADNL